MTNQEAFDKIVARLIDGTGRADDGEGGCMYRAPNGLSCAVGCLIPDDEYDEGIEGEYVHALDYLGCLDGLNVEMLEDAQDVHDYCRNWTGTKLNDKGIQELKRIAADYNLKMPEIAQ